MGLLRKWLIEPVIKLLTAHFGGLSLIKTIAPAMSRGDLRYGKG